MFISPAFAETTTAAADAAGGSIATSLIPIFLILGVFYFMIIRPQNKRIQEHRALVQNLQKGDTVVTGGGLIATVKKVVSDDEVVLELAQGVEARAVRSTIMTVRSKAQAGKE
jgi:preprotein translocase subunit YajC